MAKIPSIFFSTLYELSEREKFSRSPILAPLFQIETIQDNTGGTVGPEHPAPPKILFVTFLIVIFLCKTLS